MCIRDSNGTTEVQVVSWYDNENSYTSQMVRTIKYLSLIHISWMVFPFTSSVAIIQDCKFKTFGCGAAVATSSMATELVKGKTIQEACLLYTSEQALLLRISSMNREYIDSKAENKEAQKANERTG